MTHLNRQPINIKYVGLKAQYNIAQRQSHEMATPWVKDYSNKPRAESPT